MSLPLPLLARVSEDGQTYRLTARAPQVCGTPQDGRMPDRVPGAGEQYRFHFDMGKCIGCKCCVVACNEQNGNPADLNWRRVAELEGGTFPQVSRHYLSMGCNHCVDPTCLAGCPVDAYTKDAATGIVRHSAETCIGCQYCTWTCSYGVPQFNPERGVVGKCDMCHGRLSRGQTPACVGACPEGAIAIEIVATADWVAQCAEPTADSTLPVGDGSRSTTRVTAPALPAGLHAVDAARVTPEHAHWSLIVMTVLTQLSVGGFTAVWLLDLFDAVSAPWIAASAALGVAGIALGAATFHLGRPIHAYRALRMWRRSWLSREVLLFGAFSHVAAGYAALLWLDGPGQTIVGGLTAILGAGGVAATACIYLVVSRPAWNTPMTPLQFATTAALLGTLCAGAAGAGSPVVIGPMAAVFGLAQLTLVATGCLRFRRAAARELRETARLATTVFRRHLAARLLLLVVGGLILPLVATTPLHLGLALALALAGELVGRYLFFVTVVPKHLAAPYLPAARKAA